MPQKIINTKSVGFDPKGLLARPNLASRIAAIACVVTNTEATMGALMIATLGVDADIGADLYNAIENDGAKQAVMKAIAKRALSPENYAELEKVFKKIRKRRPDRNDVIHGMWGTSPNYPDALIRVDPREFMAYFAKLSASHHRGDIHKPPIPPWHLAMVWNEQDFIDVEQRLRVLMREVDQFWEGVLGVNTSHLTGP